MTCSSACIRRFRTFAEKLGIPSAGRTLDLGAHGDPPTSTSGPRLATEPPRHYLCRGRCCCSQRRVTCAAACTSGCRARPRGDPLRRDDSGLAARRVDFYTCGRTLGPRVASGRPQSRPHLLVRRPLHPRWRYWQDVRVAHPQPLHSSLPPWSRQSDLSLVRCQSSHLKSARPLPERCRHVQVACQSLAYPLAQCLATLVQKLGGPRRARAIGPC